mgnify:CR=1 FL=1
MIDIQKHIPFAEIVHHPVVIDKNYELQYANGIIKKLLIFSWYSFLGMHRKVAPQISQIITPSLNSKKDIEKSSATNLVDLLKTESSIGIASTGGPGSVPSYFLRGFPKKYLKVTVDGMNISDPTATQAETYLQNISLDNIQKIEILTQGDAVDFGDVSKRYSQPGCSNSTRGLIAAGQNPSNLNSIELLVLLRIIVSVSEANTH